jgi:small subunit ribosomal protein S3
MGQKVNPHGLRVGVIKDWDSRWYVRDDVFGDTLVEDYKLRKLLKKQLFDAGIPKIEIERSAQRVRIHIHCARPGIVIGKAGTEIEKVRKMCEDVVNKTRTEKLAVYVNVVEVKQVDKNSQLVAESIAAQLENRVSFRRAMKQSIGRAMRFGAKGIKVQVSGRLGGAEIARTEHYHEGTIPLQTLRADIDYGFAEASTTYGRIGVKVWIYAGEVLGDARQGAAYERPARRDDRRPPRRDDRRGPGGPGGRGPGGPGGQRSGSGFRPREGGPR